MSLQITRVTCGRSILVRSICVAAVTAMVAAAMPASVLADDIIPQVESGATQFAGSVNANSVYVRSGPGDSFYATMKLDKGAPVVVVGVKYDWLKIVPPEGSFSYVSRLYVEKKGDGTVGRVTKSDLNVRAGSDLNAMKTAVQTKLDENQTVAIVGEQDEYFKIKPPAGVYLYVNKQFVDPVKAITVATPPDNGSEPMQSQPVLPMVTKTPANAGDNGGSQVLPGTPVVNTTVTATTQPTNVAVAPSTQPTVAMAPATQPVPPSVVAENEFDATEASFLDAANMPIDKQPIDSLLTEYSTLSKNSALPTSMQRIADLRIGTLKYRAEARSQYLDAMKMEADARAKQQSLKAEQQELVQRVKAQDITIYSALGTLRTSSLQQAGTTLYRLTRSGHGSDAAVRAVGRSEVCQPAEPVHRCSRRHQRRRRHEPEGDDADRRRSGGRVEGEHHGDGRPDPADDAAEGADRRASRGTRDK